MTMPNEKLSAPPDAGPALDREIALQVFGGAEMVGFRCPKCGGSHFGSEYDAALKVILKRHCHDEFGRHCRWDGDPIECVPPFSTEIADAWLVVTELRKRFDTVIVESCLEAFAVRIGDYEAPAPLVHVAIDPRQGDVCFAICLAALKACRVPPSEGPTNG